MSFQEEAISSLRVRTYRAIAELLPGEVFGNLPESDWFFDEERQPENVFAEETRTDAVPTQALRFPLTTLSAALTLVAFFGVVWWMRPAILPEDRTTDTVAVQSVSLSPGTGAAFPHPAAPVSSGDRAVPIVPLPEPVLSPPSETGGIVQGGPPEAPGSPRFDNKVGIYLTASSVARRPFFSGTVESLLRSGGTALVFDVKGGAVLFRSSAPMAREFGLVRPFYELPDILRLARERGLYTIGRFVAIKDAGLTSRKPETRVQHPKTGRVLSRDWIDPSHETAISYNMEVICELAAAGIDEINLDYIRFSTAEYGALSVYSGEEKADKVEAFLRATRDTIDRCGPKTKLGISTYAILGWDYRKNLETLGQDVIRFAPLVDVISPMAYPSTFAPNRYYRPGKDPGPRDYFLVYRTLMGYRELLGPKESKKLRPWIQGYGVSVRDVADEIRAVYDSGSCGFTVWNASNAYSVAYEAIKGDKVRPEQCIGE